MPRVLKIVQSLLTITLYNTLQHTAAHCNTRVLRMVYRSDAKGAQNCAKSVNYNTLQHTATHCNDTLQHTATHCNTL